MATVEMTASQGKNSRTLRIISLVVLAIALFVTGYLAYTKATNTQVACLEGANISCDSVSSSIYAYFPRGTGIPVAYLGFLTWVVIAVLMLLENRIGFLREYGAVLLLGIAVFGFLFHSYLTYTSIVFVGAICPWCIGAHVLMTILLIVQGIRTYRQFFAR
ncbi:MAG: vitamin K epoxide reductase family protein [Chloroflexi bacterium]|nr:vitamin K epoxide reductase family protein [Chloroflexota bacterium]